MHKTFEKWVDVLVLVVLLAISAVLTINAIPLITGSVADIGKDKVATGALKPKVESMQYKVQDLLLSAIRLDPACPIDEITVKCGASSKTFDLKAEEYTADTYSLAKALMQLKPAGMSTEEFYDKDLTLEMNIDSSTAFYAYTITIGG